MFFKCDWPMTDLSNQFKVYFKKIKTISKLNYLHFGGNDAIFPHQTVKLDKYPFTFGQSLHFSI